MEVLIWLITVHDIRLHITNYSTGCRLDNLHMHGRKSNFGAKWKAGEEIISL